MQLPSRDILIFPEPVSGACQCVLLEDGQAVEWLDGRGLKSAGFHPTDTNNSEGMDRARLEPTAKADEPRMVWLEQDILLARVSRIVPSLGCAFVELNDRHEGMLPLKLAPESIKAGQSILVQIRRLTAAGKGCQLTARPQLPGIWVVYRPFETRHLPRTKLKQLAVDEQEQRTATETAFLSDLWLMLLQEQAAGGPTPRLLHRFQEPLQQVMRDWLGKEVRSVRVETLALFQKMDHLLGEQQAGWRSLLHLHLPEQEGSLSAIYGLSDLEQQVVKRLIWLKNGGRVAFDHTEALLAVDVNSAKASVHGRPEQMKLQTNLLAAQEISRQLRLRKIQGLIVIDFIRMKDAAAREQLVEHFKDLLSRDKATIRIGGLTALGLFELTRSQKK